MLEIRSTLTIFSVAVVLNCLVQPSIAADLVRLRVETIDDSVKIGYGTAIGDVDGDGKPDVLLADKTEFVWYRNPDWKRFVMVDNLTQRDNVCIAARDIDGDGRVEIAVGALWNPGDTNNSGSVHYLIPPDDRRQKWTAVELHREPTVHRMRWVKLAKDRFVLVVAPLHGRGNRGGEGDGVKLLAYDVPQDVRQPWKTNLIDDSLHMTHNFDLCQWDASSESEELVYIGREGALVIHWNGRSWQKRRLQRVQGGGEIRFGRLGAGAGAERWIATIEPLHGDKLVVYPIRDTSPTANPADRVVLASDFVQGHAIAIADLAGQGRPQIVAGWRNKNAAGDTGVRLYWLDDDGNWQSQWVDQSGMAAEDLRVGDLNGDGRPDIVAAGRATKNLRVYWNEGRQK
ncbi:MAG: FG-GAP-like repeat-containing protein [Pirellulaceae bacterium]|jgi:hypothetical protein|nr:VCBS repeat-containing protein [Planctomycetaceae bacterium]